MPQYSLVAVWTTPAGYMGDDAGEWVIRCMLVTSNIGSDPSDKRKLGSFGVLGKTLLEHHNTYDQAQQLIRTGWTHRVTKTGPISGGSGGIPKELHKIDLLYNTVHMVDANGTHTVNKVDADFLYLFDPRPPYNCWTASHGTSEPLFRPLVAWVEESKIDARPGYYKHGELDRYGVVTIPTDCEGGPSTPHSVPGGPPPPLPPLPPPRLINQNTIDIHIADITNIILPLLQRITNRKDMFDYVFADNYAFSVAIVGHHSVLTTIPSSPLLWGAEDLLGISTMDQKKNVRWLRLILFEYQIVVFCQCSMADSVLGLIPSMLREWLRGNDLRRNSETAFFYHNALVVFTEWPPRPKPLTLLYSKEFVLTVAKMKDPAPASPTTEKETPGILARVGAR